MNTHVEITVNGKPIKQYSHKGNTYIEAKIGTEYTIRIKNSSYRRKLAVVTVDGLNVITGQPHSANDIGEGYIVGAYSSFDIKGFRKDMNSVGAFKFCQAGKSYCNEKGLKGNNGVIGVRIYDQKIHQLMFGASTTWQPLYRDLHDTLGTPRGGDYTVTSGLNNSGGTANNAHDGVAVNYCATDIKRADGPRIMSMSSQASTQSVPKFDAGTTWGKEVKDAVVNVAFETEDTPSDEYVIYYDVRKNLEKIGVQFNPVKEAVLPKAFGTFATPPKGWNG